MYANVRKLHTYLSHYMQKGKNSVKFYIHQATYRIWLAVDDDLYYSVTLRLNALRAEHCKTEFSEDVIFLSNGNTIFTLKWWKVGLTFHWWLVFDYGQTGKSIAKKQKHLKKKFFSTLNGNSQEMRGAKFETNRVWYSKIATKGRGYWFPRLTDIK